MKRIATLLVAIVALALVPWAAQAGDEQKLTGEYQWDQGGASGELNAVFAPKGEGLWDVSFKFTFRGKPHTYTGTAKGSLSDGDLEGEVLNDNKRRTFTFQGRFTEGAFSGTHAEVTNGKGYRTGTLTLKI